MEKGDLEEIIQMLHGVKLPPKDTVIKLCEKAIELLTKLPNSVSINPPVTVCGDIHGQFFDLLEIFEISGQCPDTNYIFLGDYVNKGYLSVETFLLLITLNIRYPNKITLLRGGHEDIEMSKAHGFYDEVIRKYDDVIIWKKFNEVFDVLPLTAVIGGRIFCVHGGLSPIVKTIDRLQNLYRKKPISCMDIINDLMWSEPENVQGFHRATHGPGYYFGENDVDEFNRINKVNLILRSSQLALDGYREWFNGKLFTVWSAPNYCYRPRNDAAIVEVDQYCKIKLKIFEEAPISARFEMPGRYSI